MRKDLLEKLPLVCPACRRKPAKPNLGLALVGRENEKFIIDGELECLDCGKKYELKDGVVCILERKKAARFVSKETVNSYLHASYGFSRSGGKTRPFGGNAALWNALRKLAGGASRTSLDLGCGMGRSTFELAKKSALAVGLDADFQALSLAAKFSREREIRYGLKLRSRRSLPVRSDFRPGSNAVFVLANALNPPFPAESFETVCAVNLIDSVSNPVKLVREMDGLLEPSGNLIVASPFSWREEVTPKNNWLENKEVDGASYLAEMLKGRRFPELGLSYAITRKATGIEWGFWTGKAHANTFFVDIISARKLPATARRRFRSRRNC